MHSSPLGASSQDASAPIELKRQWGWIVAFGVLLVLAGLVILQRVLLATLSGIYVVGIIMIIAGVIEIINGFGMRSWDKSFFWIVIGVLYIIAGFAVIQNPVLAAGVLTLLLGAGLVAAGIVRFIMAFQLPDNAPRFLVGASGVLTFIIGVIILAHWPTSSLWVIGTLLGVDLLVAGVSWISEGLALRTQGAH